MRPSLVGLFLLKAIAWFIAWLFIWYQLGSVVTVPVGLLAKAVVASVFPDWADGVEQAGTTLVLLTGLEVTGVSGGSASQIPLFSPEVGFLQYGYGLPLLIALLFASNARRLFAKASLGAVALLPFQVWGVCFDWLKQAGIETGLASFSPLGRELIALGYQFGYLVMPALVPVLLWVAMNRRFLTTFILEATLEGATESQTDTGGNSGS
jgi:hypothetical protein